MKESISNKYLFRHLDSVLPVVYCTSKPQLGFSLVLCIMNCRLNFFLSPQHNVRRHGEVCHQETEGVEGPVNRDLFFFIQIKISMSRDSAYKPWLNEHPTINLSWATFASVKFLVCVFLLEAPQSTGRVPRSSTSALFIA